MKRIQCPKNWYLNKLTGVWAPRPSTGPHKMRECLPLALILRNRLKLALNYHETKMMCMQRMIQIDGKMRTDNRYPVGFMDVLTIQKANDHYRLLYDTKGRFTIHKIHEKEAVYKLCRVNKIAVGAKGCAYMVTHDGRTLRFPDPEIKTNDTIQLECETGKVLRHVKFASGNVCMVKSGNNVGRVGLLGHVEKHPGTFNIAHLKDTTGAEFCTRVENVMVIGEGNEPWVSLPKGDGIRIGLIEDRLKRLGAN